MLPDFRFVIGATLAVVVLAVTSFGLFMAVRVTHQAKVGPFESSRSPVFDDRADWNQFYDPAGARRFEERARKADAEVSVQRAAESPPDASPPPAVQPPAPAQAAQSQAAQGEAAQLEPRGNDRVGESAAPVPNAPTEMALAPPAAPASVAAPAPAPAEPAVVTPSEPPSPPSLATPAAMPVPATGTPPADEPHETGALPPAPAAKPAAIPARKPKTAARDPDDEDTPARRAPPKPRVVRPAQQTAQQPFASDQQYWRQQQQYAPQQRQPRQTDPFAQQSGRR